MKWQCLCKKNIIVIYTAISKLLPTRYHIKNCVQTNFPTNGPLLGDYLICASYLKILHRFRSELDLNYGFVHILRNHFLEVKDGILRPEVATVGCCRRQQHLWGHRNPYSRPEAATVPCARGAQDFISHRWIRNMWMFPNMKIGFDIIHCISGSASNDSDCFQFISFY